MHGCPRCGYRHGGKGGGVHKVETVGKGFTHKGGNGFFCVLVHGFGGQVPVGVVRRAGCFVRRCPQVVQCGKVGGYAPFQLDKSGVVSVVGYGFTVGGGLALRVNTLVQNRVCNGGCEGGQFLCAVLAACKGVFVVAFDLFKVGAFCRFRRVGVGIHVLVPFCRVGRACWCVVWCRSARRSCPAWID